MVDAATQVTLQLDAHVSTTASTSHASPVTVQRDHIIVATDAAAADATCATAAPPPTTHTEPSSQSGGTEWVIVGFSIANHTGVLALKLKYTDSDAWVPDKAQAAAVAAANNTIAITPTLSFTVFSQRVALDDLKSHDGSVPGFLTHPIRCRASSRRCSGRES